MSSLIKSEENKTRTLQGPNMETSVEAGKGIIQNNLLQNRFILSGARAKHNKEEVMMG